MSVEKQLNRWHLGGPDGTCHVWEGCVSGGRYGSLRIKGRMEKAHRASYQLTHPEEDISGLEIRHKCDFTLCINPDHLESGTHIDNMMDMKTRGRSDRIKKSRGSQLPQSILTEDSVRMIKSMRHQHSGKALAELFGVSKQTISNILTGKVWQHVL